MAEATKVNGNELNDIIKSGETVVVDFYADWCGPCQMFLPIFREHATTVDMKMVTVNIDDDQQAAVDAGVQGVPTIIIFKDGKEAFKNVGFMTPEQLTEFVNQAK